MRASAGFEPHPEPESVLAYFAGRFGIPRSVFEGHRLWHRPGAPSIWIAALGCEPPRGVPVEAMGMLVMRDPPPRGKPTSVFLQRFGAAATRNVYVVDEAGAMRFLTGGSQPVTPVDERAGYCVVRTAERVLGCGRIDGETLVSELPRGWRLTSS